MNLTLTIVHKTKKITPGLPKFINMQDAVGSSPLQLLTSLRKQELNKV